MLHSATYPAHVLCNSTYVWSFGRVLGHVCKNFVRTKINVNYKDFKNRNAIFRSNATPMDKQHVNRKTIIRCVAQRKVQGEYDKKGRTKKYSTCIIHAALQTMLRLLYICQLRVSVFVVCSEFENINFLELAKRYT